MSRYHTAAAAKQAAQANDVRHLMPLIVKRAMRLAREDSPRSSELLCHLLRIDGALAARLRVPNPFPVPVVPQRPMRWDY